MRKTLCLSLFIMTVGMAAFPALAQNTAPAASSVLSGFLNKQKPAPLQTQTVTPSPRSAYDEAQKKAAEINMKASAAMTAALSADTSKRLEEVEAMYAAEKAKAMAEVTQRPEGSNPLIPVAAVASEGKKPYAAPSNAIRVYAPKKDATGDKPRRLFNVREQ
jgi:uncharacterized membrane protein